MVNNQSKQSWAETLQVEFLICCFYFTSLIWWFVSSQTSAGRRMKVTTEKKQNRPRGKKATPSKRSVTPRGPLTGITEWGPSLLLVPTRETCTTQSSWFLLQLHTSRTGERWTRTKDVLLQSECAFIRWTAEDKWDECKTELFTFSLFRAHEYGKSPSPSSSIGSTNSGSGRSSFESRVPDVATVPDHDSSKQRPHEVGPSSCGPQHLPGPQDYTGVLNMTMAPAGKPGVIGHHIYSPYSAEQPLGQWSGPGPAQYPPPPHHLTADYTAQAVHHGYHHGNVAEWSQYPLFSYSCWWTWRTETLTLPQLTGCMTAEEPPLHAASCFIVQSSIYFVFHLDSKWKKKIIFV